MDILLGVIGIGLPVLIVLAIAMQERVIWHWLVFVVFTALITLLVVRFLPNLTGWQLGMLAFFAGLAVIGIDRLARPKEQQSRRKLEARRTADLLAEGLNRARKEENERESNSLPT